MLKSYKHSQKNQIKKGTRKGEKGFTITHTNVATKAATKLSLRYNFTVKKNKSTIFNLKKYILDTFFRDS